LLSFVSVRTIKGRSIDQVIWGTKARITGLENFRVEWVLKGPGSDVIKTMMMSFLQKQKIGAKLHIYF